MGYKVWQHKVMEISIKLYQYINTPSIIGPYCCGNTFFGEVLNLANYKNLFNGIF